jgi:hypothetical protein
MFAENALMTSHQRLDPYYHYRAPVSAEAMRGGNE